MVYTFRPEQTEFEGWGCFQARDEHTARLLEEGSLPQIDRYLQPFKTIRLRLVRKLRGRTWLAYPSNGADMKQRWGWAKPVPIHLVAEGTRFAAVIARWDGRTFWFDDLDRRTEFSIEAQLRQALEQETLPEDLRFKALTPDLRIAYELVFQSLPKISRALRSESRLQQALAMGGGKLDQSTDQGSYWTVQWTTANGEQHTSAIAKKDLTVMGAGICLSDRDSDFDLQSLVGVVENRWE